MKQTLAVGAAAALGAVVRALATTVAMPLPLSLLLVNIIGCALMGAFKPGPVWGTGFLGGFTSFSTYIAVAGSNSPLQAALYLLITPILCVGSYLLAEKARSSHAA